MTQSGQGEEPSRRPAREGIVLPSDGGEPLLPGTTGVSAGPPSGPPVPHPASAPDGGPAWNQAWGPGGHQGPPAGHEASGGPGPWGAPGQQTPDAWADRTPPGPPPQPGPGPLPPEGAQPPAYGTQQGHGAQPPAYGDQQGYAQQQGYDQQQGYGAQPPAYGAQQPPYAPQGGYGGPGGGPAAPLPPAYAQEQATQYLPPVQDLPAADGGATQYIPYVPPAPAPADEGATQYLPPVQDLPAADGGATQYLPPVVSGALPPERPVRHHAEQGPGPLPPPATGSDAEATQYLPPVPGQPAGAPFGGVPGGDAERQPPAEFDSLFRGAPAADGPSGSTQQMPVGGGPRPPRPGGAPYDHAPQDAGGGRRGGGRGGRTGPRVPLIAAVGVAIAVVGIGTGALLADGGGDDDADKSRTVSATAPATEGSASTDPAREQAVALDALLADSGDSRQAVIDAVADVKSCDNLSRAAQSLRDAARQRAELVTRLEQLSVDQLPGNAELTAALTEAWQASASADNHYAAWADQAAGKKGCKKGQARATGQTAAGNKESGVASARKTRAAELWNVIAKKWGLTERTPVQL